MSDYNCGTCETVTCEFHPMNEAAYFVDEEDDKVKMYPGVEIVHEFTAMKGCAVHSTFMLPLDRLALEIKGGHETYMELIETTKDNAAYGLAAKALSVCLLRIDKIKRGE